jgi:hypothetical protein
MKGRKRRRAEKRRRLPEEEAFDGYDNFDIVDTSERLPSDYWALREREEEYCKEYGYC